MAKFSINKTPEEKQLFRDEWEAYEENQRYDICLSIRNRTMTKELYYKLIHSLRLFFWHGKQNMFKPMSYIF